MMNNISDSLRLFFNRCSEKRRLPLYQALVSELANIRTQSGLLESSEKLNSLKHQLKGICRYLALELDAQIDVMTTAEQL
ncbi:MAG: hypothetical protein QNK26_03375, partial [Moritella sp.]|uniref:hypothetical protein n=1 Tax=Moritella sp. TaxID=78556 RepID=UPI0029B8647D